MTTENLSQRQIIQTKLHRPPVTEDHICRQRLHEHLDLALRTPLTLVSAPAGYGKSVLVSYWAESLDEPCAWISLEEDDSDLRLFMGYLVAAVDTVAPGAFRRTRDFLGAAEFPPVAILAGHVINELDAIDKRILIVLDDYQRIGLASPIHTFLDRILEHPPRKVHFVLVTRRDPPLGLARYRGDNRLVDVRLRDLRFTESETAELLKKCGYAPDADAIAGLQKGVEGWAAGLRLVTLALRNTENPVGLLEHLRGGLPHVQDYLLEEVLAAQTPAMRECMIESSILDRFCPQLLDAVCATGTTSRPEFGGREILDQLQRDNLFTIPLDSRGDWFRYHHLFQDLLKQQLQRHSPPNDIAALHARASEWLESQNLTAESIGHALAAGDVERAADIVERQRYTELEADRWFVIQRWLDQLPAGIKQQRPGLLIAEAWVKTFQLQLADLYPIIERAEALLDAGAAKPAEMGELNYFRGLLLYYDGKGEDSLRCFGDALTVYPAKNGMIAGEMEMYLALARHMSGEGEIVVADVGDKIRSADPVGQVFLSRLVATEAFIYLFSGDLGRLEPAAKRITSIGQENDATYIAAWGLYLEGLAQLHSYRLEDALSACLDVVERRDFVTRKAAVDALMGVVLSYQFMQQPDCAMNAAEDLIAFVRELGDSELTLAAESCRARLWLLQGDLKPAVDWARSASIEPHAPSMFFWLDNPPITRARVQIAEGSEESLHRALEFLDVLRPQLEAMHNTCQTIEVAVLQVLALARQQRTDEALAALEGAAALARPGGWIRPFVEAGPVISALLQTLGSSNEGDAFISRILEALSQTGAAAASETRFAKSAGPLPGKAPHAIDPLTGRELEVLELLGQRLTNKEIAARLFISAHTVNDHLKNIYEKLDVKSRRQAVVRAVETGIIDLRSSG